ncbi:hypothetical protein HPB50_027246 [Hyalomma asiaticum]|uniref:Uncharacterized protein n=1 Tax=Hyalomma asiaticum TaxID=266040 RepID=A0ACB7SAW0_HYAAI|nr:hypothetical protein HPB50_027246 [Hyalomma asiaticum]
MMMVPKAKEGPAASDQPFRAPGEIAGKKEHRAKKKQQPFCDDGWPDQIAFVITPAVSMRARAHRFFFSSIMRAKQRSTTHGEKEREVGTERVESRERERRYGPQSLRANEAAKEIKNTRNKGSTAGREEARQLGPHPAQHPTLPVFTRSDATAGGIARRDLPTACAAVGACHRRRRLKSSRSFGRPSSERSGVFARARAVCLDCHDDEAVADRQMTPEGQRCPDATSQGPEQSGYEPQRRPTARKNKVSEAAMS